MSDLPGSVPDDLCGTASADAEVCGQKRGKRDLSLSPEQRELARFLKKSYGFSWPFAAHISKDVLAYLAAPTQPHEPNQHV